MEEPVLEITICMGSSCFSRGNKKTLPAIMDYLRETGRTRRVIFKGSHCLGKCVEGPLLKINDNLFCQVTESNVIEFLDAFFENK